jgi:hypothetical protein
METMYHPPKDRFCPICACGNNKSENIRVCWQCQIELMPEGEEGPEYETMNIDYNGFYHTMY